MRRAYVAIKGKEETVLSSFIMESIKFFILAKDEHDYCYKWIKLAFSKLKSLRNKETNLADFPP